MRSYEGVRLMKHPLILGSMLGLVGLGALVVFQEAPDFVLVQKSVDTRPLWPGRRAPAFQGKSCQGERISRADLQGRSAVLVFVTPTCPYCQALKEEMVQLDSVDWQNRLVFVSRERPEGPELPEAIQALETRVAGRWPVLPDTSGGISRAFQIRGVPTAYRLTPAGRIQAVGNGVPGSLELVRALREELVVGGAEEDGGGS